MSRTAVRPSSFKTSNWSVCNTCGTKVFWTNRADKDRRIPLEQTGQTGWALSDDDTAYAIDIWKRHLCDPADVEHWNEERQERERKEAVFQAQRKLAAAQRQAAHQTEIDAYREELWKIATSVACPKCNAEVDKRCVNLIELRKGNTVETQSPHQERIQNLNVPQYPKVQADG